MFSDELKSLVEIDALRETSAGDPRCLIHRDHRWTLALLHRAQEKGLIPRPCNLVTFDAHHHALEPAVPAALIAFGRRACPRRISLTSAPCPTERLGRRPIPSTMTGKGRYEARVDPRCRDFRRA